MLEQSKAKNQNKQLERKRKTEKEICQTTKKTDKLSSSTLDIVEVTSKFEVQAFGTQEKTLMPKRI